MAQISFTAFVEEWTQNNPAHPDWAMRTAEVHYKKDGDKYVAVARTYRTVKNDYQVGIDFTQFKKGDRVKVSGKEVTEVSEKDGKKFYNLVVKAATVEIDSEMGRGPEWSDVNASLASIGATPVTASATPEEAPF